MNQNQVNSAVVVAARPALRVLIQATGVVGFALLTAFGAQVAIPLPYTPVPLTLQTLIVVLAGISLGPRLGLLSMAFYLLLGTVGYHVFAEGRWGLATLFGATGGYLLGFVAAQPLLGTLVPTRAGWRQLIVGVLAAHAVIFACGLTWLSVWLNTDLPQTLALGFFPFLPGLLLKTALAVLLGRALSRTLRPYFTA